MMEGAAAALRALEEVIPPHLRRNRHGENFMGERYATILAALENADRFEWLEAQRGLELVSQRGGSLWKRPDGSTFFASHRLAAGDTQFSAQETLKQTIDCARVVQQARKG